MILMLLLLFSLRPPKVLVGTDIMHAVILTGVAGLFHLGIGTVDLPLVGLLLVGSLPGSLLGVRLGAFLPVGWLRRFLVLLLLPSVNAADEKAAESPSPAEQYRALVGD